MASRSSKVRLIKRVVARHFEIPMRALSAPTRGTKDVYVARAIAIKLSRDLTDWSYPQIAEAFKRDHSTVIHACDRIVQLAIADHRIASDFAAIHTVLTTHKSVA